MEINNWIELLDPNKDPRDLTFLELRSTTRFNSCSLSDIRNLIWNEISFFTYEEIPGQTGEEKLRWIINCWADGNK